MLTTRSFVVTLASLLVGGVLYGVIRELDGGDGGKPGYSADSDLGPLRNQPVRERLFREMPETRIFTVGDGSQTFFGPIRLKLGPAGDVFVTDLGVMRVYKLSDEGEIEASYGLGRGQGPGELAMITDMSITRTGRVWVADMENGKIAIFDGDGEWVDDLRLNPRPYRLAIQDSREFLLLRIISSATLFALYTEDGESYTTFGKLLNNQVRNSLALDGWVAATPDDGFVYAGLYAGVLASFSKDGSARFLVHTIDPSPLPRVLRKGGRTWVDQSAEGSSWALSVTENEIYLLSVMKDGFRRAPVLDTYDLHDGVYLYSYSLPELAQSVAVGERVIYTATDTTVTKWLLP